MAKPSYSNSSQSIPEKKDGKMSKDIKAPGPQMARRIEAELLKQGFPEGQSVKTAMAEAAGISETSIYKWFDGSTKSPQGIAVAFICQEYNLDTQWILLGGKTAIPKKNEENQPLPEQSVSSESSNNILLKDDVFMPITTLVGRIQKICLAATVQCKDVPAALSEICAVTPAVVRQWGDGTLHPSADDLAAICKNYGIDLFWLVTGVLLGPQGIPTTSSINSGEFNDLGNVQLRPWRTESYAN